MTTQQMKTRVLVLERERELLRAKAAKSADVKTANRDHVLGFRIRNLRQCYREIESRG